MTSGRELSITQKKTYRTIVLITTAVTVFCAYYALVGLPTPVSDSGGRIGWRPSPAPIALIPGGLGLLILIAVVMHANAIARIAALLLTVFSVVTIFSVGLFLVPIAIIIFLLLLRL